MFKMLSGFINQTIALIVLLPFLLIHFNCATIFAPQKYTVIFEANVDGAVAELRYNADTLVETVPLPGSFTFNFREYKRNQVDPFVDIYREGYEHQRIFILRTLSYWVFLNYLMVFTSALHITDVLTGAVWKPMKDYHYVELKKIQKESDGMKPQQETAVKK